MEIPMTERKHIPVALLALALLGGPSAHAQEAPEARQDMALRGVMKQLGQDMQAVTGAISEEDWQLVAQLAPRIGQHEEPPAREKMRILGWLGADARKFRNFDLELGKGAENLQQAAEQEDGQAVIAAFGKLQQSCLACHQSFRQPFVQHFYGER